MTRNITRLGLTLAAIVAGASVSAQTPNTGLLSGKVLDEKGGPVVGATVTLSGPAMQGARSSMTDAEGKYRFPFVPTGGWYQLSVTKQGIVAPSVRNIGVEAWKTIINDIKTKPVASVQSVGATVEVVAGTSNQIVDTTTVTTSSTFSSDALKALPLGSRDASAAAYLTPGVADGGRGQANPNIAGGTAFENNYVVDGVNVTDPLYGENLTRVNNLAVESVQIQTGGFEPEYGRATGGVISVVTKTGSNKFQAEMEVTSRPKSSIARATAQADLSFNAARIDQGNQTTTSFWLGGPIIKDKLWYSLGISADKTETSRSYGLIHILDPEQVHRNPLARPWTPADSATMTPGLNTTNTGTGYNLDSKALNITGKLTYSINTDNTLEYGFARNRAKDDQNTLGMTFNQYVDTSVANDEVDTHSLNWRSTITSSWVVDARIGLYQRKNYDSNQSAQYDTSFVASAFPPYAYAGELNAAGTAPLFNTITRGYPGMQLGGIGVTDPTKMNRTQATIKGTNFFGNHTVKYGIDYDKTEYENHFRYTGDSLVTRRIQLDPMTGVINKVTDIMRFRSGPRGVVPMWTNPDTGVVEPAFTGESLILALNRDGQANDAKSKTENLAIFVQDNWQINNFWTVTYGVRLDSQKLYGGEGNKYLEFKFSDMAAPRIGITWDPSGAGKQKLSFNWGRFYETIPMDLNQRAGSMEGFVRLARDYTVALGDNPTAVAFSVPTTSAVLTANNFLTPNAYTWDQIGGLPAEIDPAIKPQAIEEIGLRYEQQLTELWKFAAGYKFRWYKNVVEDFSFDFGDHYLLGNPGQTGKGLEPAHIVDYDFVGQNETFYFPKPVRNYREYQVTVAKAKGADRWAMDASLTFAENKGNFAGMDSPLNGQADPNITSTYDLPVLMRNTYGILPNSPRYTFQMTGTVDLGLGFSAGARFFFRGGTAISALGPDLGAIKRQNQGAGTGAYYMYNGTFLHAGNYGDNEALLEPRGSRGFTPDVNRFDLHLEYMTKIPVMMNARFTAFVDVFNLFNQQMVLTVNQTKELQNVVVGTRVDANGAPLAGAASTGYVSAPNPRFLMPTSFQAPRSLQFGVRLQF